jgi:Protein of unknown function (DUF2934)
MAKLTERLRKGAQNLREGAGGLQERIRERARAIREREGRPEGRHDEHWRQAEKEISDETVAGPAAKKGRATGLKTVKVPNEAKITTAAAELAPGRRPTKSEPVADAATAQEVAEKGKASKTRNAGKAPKAARRPPASPSSP